MATLIIGLLVTGALVLVSHSQYVSNEKRLLNLRVRDAAALLGESVPSTTATLAAAVEQADFTNGSVPRFERLVGPDVGIGGRAVAVAVAVEARRAEQGPGGRGRDAAETGRVACAAPRRC